MPHLEMILKLTGLHVIVMMPQAMLTQHRSIAKTGHQMVVFRAKMEIDVQPKSDKKHIKCHQSRPYLKDFSFHGANLKKNSNFVGWNNIT